MVLSESKMEIMDTEPKRKSSDDPQHFRKDIITYLREYCNKSGLHGLQYIAENRTWYERLWWFIFVILSVSCCIYMILQIYVKWLQSPVLVSFATKKTPFYDVPFPAVTICPKVKTDLKKPGCLNMTDYMYRKRKKLPITEEEELHAGYMHVMCDEEVSDSTNVTMDGHDFYKYISECEPERKVRMQFMNEYFVWQFNETFKPTLTEEGLCYSFNRMRLDEIYTDQVIKHNKGFEDFPKSSWDPEKGYSSHHVHTYPRRGLVPNIKNGLGIYFFEDKKNKDYICDPIMQGYTVTVHLPCRPASTREEFFFVPFNSAVLAPIEAKVTLTSDTIRQYRPHSRGCFFPSEKKLKYFKHYTNLNCQSECLSDYLLEKCGCVKFYMPRNKTTPVCGPYTTSCTNDFELETRLEPLKIKLGDDDDDEDGRAKSLYEKCDCLPMCNDIVYSTDAAGFEVNSEQIKSWMMRYDIVDQELVNDPDIMTTYIMLYLKESYIETTERNELYGPSDFLSNFGGLMGLFTGFSMLSCVEIIYFLTLRIIANVKLFGHWTGVPEEQSNGASATSRL